MEGGLFFSLDFIQYHEVNFFPLHAGVRLKPPPQTTSSTTGKKRRQLDDGYVPECFNYATHYNFGFHFNLNTSLLGSPKHT